tara:strand:+ start:2099 stop:3220 length:1122 start_codon:yes stop_codon:yes gene_type:complete
MINLNKLLRLHLKDDIEYKNILNNPHREFTISWGLKRAVKRKLIKFKALEKLEWLVYFKYHKFRVKHFLKLLINFYIKKEIYISFQSGFGDMLMCYPYFRKAKERYPKHKLFAVIHHPKFCKFKEMSYCKECFLIHEGKKIDYLYEFIENNPFLDEIIYDDCWNDGYIYGYPKVLENEFGFCFNKDSFLKDKKYIFTDQDTKISSSFYKKNNLENCIVISSHFKTSRDKISNIIYDIAKDSIFSDLNVKFILFGSIPKSLIDNLKNINVDFIDISSSYSKGINTRQLVAIASSASLFIGGRGGFNGIYYLLDTPTINIFDQQGMQEKKSGLWPSNLWEENLFKKVFFDKDSNQEIINHIKDNIDEIVSNNQGQ